MQGANLSRKKDRSPIPWLQTSAPWGRKSREPVLSHFQTRWSSAKGWGLPIVILEKPGCFGLITRLCSSGMIAEGTRSIAETPPFTHSVPRFFAESGGGDESQPGFSSLAEISTIFKVSGISTRIARRDLLILMSFLVKWMNNSRAASDSVPLT